MLKNITILKGEKPFYTKIFASAFKDPDFLEVLLVNVSKEMKARNFADNMTLIDMLAVKIICWRDLKEDLLITLTFDDSVEPSKIEKDFENLVSITKENLDNKKKLEEKALEICHKLIKDRPPKVSIIGDTGVGKTSICHLLMDKEPVQEYRQTNTLENYEVELYGFRILLWDYSGAISENLMRKFLLGSDAVVLVFDAARKLPKQYKHYMDLVEQTVPHAELLVVTTKVGREDGYNKEDLKMIMPDKFLAIEGNKDDKRDLLKEQIAKLLEIQSDDLDYSKDDYIIQRND